MNNELTNCPKCNGEAEIIGHYMKGVANIYHYFIWCKECRYRKNNEYKNRDKAIDRWNNQSK